MNNIKKIAVIRILAIAFGVFVIPPSLFVFMADPCHIFHKPFPGIFHHGFTGFAICQNAGLIKTYLNDPQENYDSFLTGTSLSGNFLSERISALTPWRKTMKLTMPSAAPSLIQLYVELALATGNIHHVFWEIFPFKFLPYRDLDDKIIATEFGDFPAYLYNGSRLDDYRYLFNYTILGASLGVIYGEDFYNIKSIDDINFWKHSCNSAKECQPFNDAESIRDINKNYHHSNHIIRPIEDISAINYAAVDRYVLRTILPYCNSSTSFDIFFLPYPCCGIQTSPTATLISSYTYSGILLTRQLLVRTCEYLHSIMRIG